MSFAARSVRDATRSVRGSRPVAMVLFCRLHYSLLHFSLYRIGIPPAEREREREGQQAGCGAVETIVEDLAATARKVARDRRMIDMRTCTRLL